MEKSASNYLFCSETASSPFSMDSAATFDVFMLTNDNFATPQQQMPTHSAAPTLSPSSSAVEPPLSPSLMSQRKRSINVSKKRFKFRKPSTQDRVSFPPPPTNLVNQSAVPAAPSTSTNLKQSATLTPPLTSTDHNQGEAPSTPSNSPRPGREPVRPATTSTSRKTSASSTTPSSYRQPAAATTTPTTPTTMLPQQLAGPARLTSAPDRPPSLTSDNGKRIYLITYSQADIARFPERKDFGSFVATAFNESGGSVKAQYWAVCKEPHANGGVHYHCSVRLSGTRRWKKPYDWMVANGVIVDISDQHEHYVSIHRYVCKMDKAVYESPNHPDISMISSPRTKPCIEANRRRAAERNHKQLDNKQQEQPKEEYRPRSRNMRLNNLQVAEFVIKKNISTVTQLFAQANARKRDGECDLALFVMNNSEAKLGELIYKAWMLHNAEKIITEESKSRLQRLADAYEGQCVVTGCDWLVRAKEVLAKNSIPWKDFSMAVYDSLFYGRQKFRNIILVGPSNTAKTFLLKPLQAIFGEKLFENPSRDKYCWSGIEKCQVAVLQDFRYSKEMIAWGDFLLLLEGESVHLPTPKCHFAQDIHLKSDNDIPFFATSIGKIEYSRFSPDYHAETEMMDSRWKVFKFSHKFEGKERKVMEPCGRCFAELISSR